MGKIKLSPSMMCADFLNLQRELDLFQQNEIDFLHIDIMDGHYVPNLTLGIDFCRSMKSYSPIPLDIHLMVENVDFFVERFCEFEGSWVSFHPETTWHPVRTIEVIKKRNCRAGIAIDTGVPIEQFKELYPLVDFVLIMTVTPGFAGQKLLPFCLDKIKQLKDYFNENNIRAEIEVDGNVSWESIPQMVENGATMLVNGSSSIFDKAYKRKEAIDRVRKMLEVYEKA
ncbi:MAG: ribulose-phosphate 3-epimerase [Bacteroidales bacterium]|nr:ribulose-phosphate 3-epimerase [Bacteroidales bacterium]